MEGDSEVLQNFTFGGQVPDDPTAEPTSFADSSVSFVEEARPHSDSPGRAKGRPAVSAEVLSEAEVAAFQHVPVPKSPEDVQVLNDCLKTLALFSQLDDRELKVLIEAMAVAEFKAGEVIIREGERLDSEHTHFYLVDHGKCTLYMKDKPLRTIRNQDCFGEVELLYGQPRAFTVIASIPTRCWTLDRTTYRVLMTGTFKRKREQYGDFLRNIGFLKGLTSQELVQLADALQPAVYRKGEVLIEFGSPGHWFYIIVEGTAKVRGRDADGSLLDVCTLGRGACVGEIEFIYHHKTVAEVIAESEELRTARLSRPHFEMCMGPVIDVLKRHHCEAPEYHYYQALPPSAFDFDLELGSPRPRSKLAAPFS